MSADVHEAVESFSTECLGFPRTVQAGETFRDGHAIVKAHPGAFQPWTVDNDVEQASAAPGEKRRGRPKKATTTGEKSEAETKPAEESGAAED